MDTKYDYLIVGAGLFGAVFAQQCLEKKKTCLVIDKRNHIAGNCYTERVEDIDVHIYGPHIFNTNSEEVWKYANRFSDFVQYTHKVRVNYKDKIYPFPINMDTLYGLYGVKTPEEAKDKLKEVCVPITEPKNMEEWCLANVGPELYEIFIKGYTTKQWGKSPKDLPASIIKRVPVRFTYDDRYHNKNHSGIPSEGYTAWIANILDGVKIELGVDFFKMDWKKYAKKVVYAGKIDELFDYCYGDLEYRTLWFDYKTLKGDYQGVTQMNYTDEEVAWTRITEHKHFNNRGGPNTVISCEFSALSNRQTTPYYPIGDEANVALFRRYKDLLDGSMIVGGRLGDYQYYDMDQVIASSLKRAKEHL